jgi:hypothetical protein
MKWFTRVIGTRSRERLDSDLETIIQPHPDAVVNNYGVAESIGFL